MIPLKIPWSSIEFLKIQWRKMLGFRGIEVIIDAFSLYLVLILRVLAKVIILSKIPSFFYGVPNDTMEYNVGKALGNINNLLDVIISLFSVDSECTGGGDDSVKDSLVFHGVPKDTMEENVGKVLGNITT